MIICIGVTESHGMTDYYKTGATIKYKIQQFKLGLTELSTK